MNPYSLNCAVKPVWREFEKGLAQKTLPAGAGFQEAPALDEINSRDFERQKVISATSGTAKVHDALMMAQIENTQDPLLKSAYATALAGQRLNGEQGQILLDSGDLNLLGWLATRAKERFHPQGKVSF
ncbi:MAG: hypothetical protein EBR09_13270, partial [Proteobacteria bacterium]|nr:hypothetical protein [Pseudomonadota bacterium]